MWKLADEYVGLISGRLVLSCVVFFCAGVQLLLEIFEGCTYILVPPIYI